MAEPWEEYAGATVVEPPPPWEEFRNEKPPSLREFVGLGPAGPAPAEQPVQPPGWIERSFQTGEPPSFPEFMFTPPETLPPIKHETGESTQEKIDRSLGNVLRGAVNSFGVPIAIAAPVPAMVAAVPEMAKDVVHQAETAIQAEPGSYQQLEAIGTGALEVGGMALGGRQGFKGYRELPKLSQVMPKPQPPVQVIPPKAPAATQAFVQSSPEIPLTEAEQFARYGGQSEPTAARGTGTPETEGGSPPSGETPLGTGERNVTGTEPQPTGPIPDAAPPRLIDTPEIPELRATEIPEVIGTKEGKNVERLRNAHELWDEAHTEKSLIQQLLDCV